MMFLSLFDGVDVLDRLRTDRAPFNPACVSSRCFAMPCS